MRLNFPNGNGENGRVEIEVNQPIVIVGANGSGKSRFGFFINRKNAEHSRMISAQRNLGLPPQLPERWTLERGINEFNGSKIQTALKQYIPEIK